MGDQLCGSQLYFVFTIAPTVVELRKMLGSFVDDDVKKTLELPSLTRNAMPPRQPRNS